MHMRNFAILIFVLFSCQTFSQATGMVKGTILDATMGGEPMLFAHVGIKNTDWAVQTNLHGNFEMTAIHPGEHVLVVSYPGYQPLELTVVVEQDKITAVNGSMKANEITLQIEVARYTSDSATTPPTGLADISENALQE